MKRLIRCALLALTSYLIICASASATSFYIAVNGSDANNGTSKTAPWAHLPGMRTWTGTYTPVGGDNFILRGCDVWPNASFPITWPSTWSGTLANRITITRDVTWFNTTNCPSGWNRAIFDAQSAIINPPEGSIRNYFLVISASFVTFSWIEARNLFWTAGNTCVKCAGFVENNGPANQDYVLVDHWYVHHWTAGAGATHFDNQFDLSCVHCGFTDNVINNSDGVQNLGGGLAAGILLRNVIKYVVDVFKISFGAAGIGSEIGYNEVSFIQPNTAVGAHPNCIETLGGTTFYIHDNYFHDIVVCEGLQVGNTGETDYVWNNIWYMNGGAGSNGPQWPSLVKPATSMYFWNNTVFWSGGCFRTDGSNWAGDFVVQNNHCINDGLFVSSNPLPTASGVFAVDHNIATTIANAALQGYTGTTAYVFSALNGNCNAILTNCPIGAGINKTSGWPTGYSTNDTTYACSQQTLNGVIQAVCPQRNSLPRPPSGSWDIGAYMYPAGGLPNPPTALAAVVQ